MQKKPNKNMNLLGAGLGFATFAYLIYSVPDTVWGMIGYLLGWQKDCIFFK